MKTNRKPVVSGTKVHSKTGEEIYNWGKWVSTNKKTWHPNRQGFFPPIQKGN